MDAITTGNAIRCVIYLRVSLDATGEQLAITRQREDCMRIAAQRGWEIVAEYVDNSIGAYSKTRVRPGYNSMVQAYEAGEFGALICWDLDRLTRQPRQLEDWIDRAEDRGLLLVTANGEADLSNDNGRLFARIKAGVARAESERKAARQKSALRQRAAAGKPPLGVRLTGYTTAGEIVEDEAVIVREIFAQFYEGTSLRVLVACLAANGVETRNGRPWNPSTVRGILTNPRYAGRSHYNRRDNGQSGSWAPGAWPPLVEDWMFDIVQDTLADPRRRLQVGTDRKHVGAGLYLCGIPGCDQPVRSHSKSPAKGGGMTTRYRCKETGHLTRSAGPVDELVKLAVCDALADMDARAAFLPESSQGRQVGEEIKALRGRLRKAELDYDNDLIDGARYKAKKDKITAELDAAETARAAMTAGPDIARQLAAWGTTPEEVADGYDGLSVGSKQTLIRSMMTVRLLKAPRGPHFDPASVVIKWRRPGA